jgi:type I restriction enzyme M protein
MLSPQLRKKVHSLWSLFWTAGIANPLAAIEQITYLLFIRQLEALDRDRVKAGKKSIYGKRSDDAIDYEQCRWTYIRQNPSFRLLNDVVFPWIRSLEDWLRGESLNGDDRLRQVTGRLSDAYFILDTNKTDTLTRAIGLIDDLFRHLDTRSANADIMGDIFEHLLEEIKESGKNGQFRTPRHVIRFMVEALNPALGSKVLDPACGSGGFLLNTLLHWKAQYTDPQVLKKEWDGTPHDAFAVFPPDIAPDLSGCFYGYDNDRTMVRIAWMNLLLHDLEFPSVQQLDSLSKRLQDSESGTYDHVLANPPFTGNVDEGDLSANRQRFPGGKGNKPITTKSELLFVWLILDLLRLGGRGGVVVPDGVLFGNTNAHRELRRQLLFENTLEAVISLPANMFQPYSGVKTSILIFQKAQTPYTKPSAGDPPRTSEVWFYEVKDEAYSLDQKRKARYAQDNDLWDALAKFVAWKRYLDSQAEDKPANLLQPLRDAATSLDYWQPKYWEERWRSIDDEFLRIFPEKATDKGHTYPLYLIWPDIPRDPRAAELQIASAQRPTLERIFSLYCIRSAQHATTKSAPQEWVAAAPERAAKDLVGRVTKLVRDENLLDREFDEFGFNALRPLLDEMKGRVADWVASAPPVNAGEVPSPPDVDFALAELRGVIREFAKLDGYNVWRQDGKSMPYSGKRRANMNDGEERTPTLQSWIVPVRVWDRRESWGVDPETDLEVVDLTHDDQDRVRSEYLTFLSDRLNIFNADGTVKKEYVDRLDPECIEALDFNLSASRHKPFIFDPSEHRPPSELIGELDFIYAEIRERLGRLLQLVEGK